MIIKPNWNKFKAKFDDNPQKNFEWLCYLLFCKEFNMHKGISRYKNQSGIETNPIINGNEVIGWQAKFYENSLSDYKDDLIKAVEKVNKDYTNVTKIIFYTNQEWGQGKKQNAPQAKISVEEKAKKFNIEIEWRTASYFESPFVTMDNNDIAHHFFSMEENSITIVAEKQNTKYNEKWFEQKLNESIENIDNRYSKELNVELKISIIMNAIEKSKAFKDNLNKSYYIINQRFLTLKNSTVDIKNEFFNRVLKNMAAIKLLLNESDKSNNSNIKLSELKKECIELKNKIDSNSIKSKNFFYYKIFKEEVDKFTSYLMQDYIKLVNNPFAMLVGKPGVGKSHFIANEALRRQKEGKLSILLLGQLFRTNENPLEQIRHQLNISQNEDMNDFFAILDDYGKARNERIIIFIDALNEGNGKEIWKSYIAGFVEYIKQYKWIGLVMSVRSTYESEIVPDNFFKNDKVIKIKFNGFDDLDKAIEEFFSFYNVPLRINDNLRFKFENPLFLKIYCISYSEETENKNDSMQDIFDNYFRKIDSNLRDRIRNYPKGINLVKKALEAFIDIKLTSKKSNILYEEAFEAIDSKINRYGLSINFLEELINENVITRNNKEDESIMYLAYELFEDYLIAKKIIESNKVCEFSSKFQLNDFFSVNNQYYYWLTDNYSNQGVFEALTIQIPDLDFKIQTNEFELYYWPTNILNYKEISFESAFYNSMIWRNPKKIKKVAHSYILNKSLCMAYSEPYVFNYFFDRVLELTAVKEHCYNANFLYDFLMPLKLSEFDRFWTSYLDKDFHENTTFKTLIKWAWKSNINGIRKDEETVLLIGMNLSWFLASTNRNVRDVSIKAMVKLFTSNIKLLIELLVKFRNVKDLYILEGLLCTAYGCVLNTDEISEIEKLSKYVYKEFFDNKFLIQHALIRDYLSSIIEYSISKGFFSNINIEDIRPPYNNPNNYYEVSQQEIDVFRKDEYSDDAEKLDPNVSYHEELDLYYECQNIIIDSLEINCTDIENEKKDYIQDFESAEKIHYILPEYRNNFIRMVIKEIFDMGYNYIKFGEFDLSYTSRYGDNNKSVSIGQKYEWIALNKILTIYLDSKQYICDNYEENKFIKFQGMWQFWSARWIDPSIDYWNPIESKMCEEESHEIIVESVDDVIKNPSSYFENRNNNDDWISVGESTYTIISKKDNPTYSFWGNVINDRKLFYATPFLINNDELTDFNEYLQKKTISHRNSNIEDLYAKEIYWSQAYNNMLVNKSDNKHLDKFSERKFSCQCVWDINDGAMNNYIEFSILTPYIVKELNLLIGTNVFELFQENELACFNLYDKERKDVLLLKKSIISKYLIDEKKSIVWVIYNYQINNEENGDSNLNIKRLLCFDGISFYEFE